MKLCVCVLVCMHDVSLCLQLAENRECMQTLLYCPSDCIGVKECEAPATVNSMKLETMRPRFNQGRRESRSAIDLRSCHNPLIKNIAWFNFTALTDLLIAISVLEVAFARNEL